MSEPHQDRSSENVIRLDRARAARRGPEAGPGLSALRQAEGYWTALCRDGEIPRRSRIDPRGIQNILGQACILERIAPGLARFRLAGHDLTDRAGMDLRGMPLSCLFTPAARQPLAEALEHLFAAPAVVELSLRGERRLLHRAPGARLLLLPLRGDAGDVTRALGVLVCDPEPPARGPHRFDLADIALRPVRARPRARRERGALPALSLVT